MPKYPCVCPCCNIVLLNRNIANKHKTMMKKRASEDNEEVLKAKIAMMRKAAVKGGKDEVENMFNYLADEFNVLPRQFIYNYALAQRKSIDEEGAELRLKFSDIADAATNDDDTFFRSIADLEATSVDTLQEHRRMLSAKLHAVEFQLFRREHVPDNIVLNKLIHEYAEHSGYTQGEVDIMLPPAKKTKE